MFTVGKMRQQQQWGRCAAPRRNWAWSDPPRAAAWYGGAKAAADVVLAFLMLAVSAPLILLAAAAVKLTSPGPVFYSQTRLGRGGRPFRIYKIRTMAHNCERQSGARWATVGDSRITPV